MSEMAWLTAQALAGALRVPIMRAVLCANPPAPLTPDRLLLIISISRTLISRAPLSGAVN
jgi:hypothetical protein